MFDQKLREQKPQRHSNKLSVHDEPIRPQLAQIKSASESSDSNKTNSSDSDKPHNNNLDAAQQNLVEELKVLLQEDPLSKLALMDMEEGLLSFWGLFKIIFLTHHFCWGLFYGLSSKYSKATLIANILTHFVYVLALTMALGLGWDKSAFTGYQMFIFKCFISPFLVSFLGLIIKMLSKHEADYGLSFLNWCPRKVCSEGESQKKVHQEVSEAPEERPHHRNKSMVHPTNNSKSQVNQSTESVSKANPRSVRPKPTRLEQPTQPTEVVLTLNSPPNHGRRRFAWVEIEKKEPTKNWYRRPMIYAAYLLTIIFVPLSFMSIYQTVAALEENNKEWPFGYWFLIQFVYELTFGKVLNCLFQLGMFKSYLRYRHRTQLSYVKSFIHSFCNFMLNSDIKDLMEISDRIHSESPAYDFSKQHN